MTEHNSSSEKKQGLLSAAAYMLIARFSIKSLGLVSSVFLARILTPSDFGLVAIAVAVYAFIEIFGALGFGTALIQRKDKNINEYNTAWTFKCIFGLFSAVVIVGLAYPIAKYFEDDRLVNILHCLAFIAALSGFNNIGVIDFQKDLQFHKELKFLLLPKFFSFIFTLTVAFIFKNYWALVLGMLFSQILNLIFSFTMHPFRPKLTLVSLPSLLNFSKWVFLSNIVIFINTKITELIIGKKLSMTDAGLFSIANEFASIPTTEIAAPINKAAYPVYAQHQNESELLKKSYLNTLLLTSCLTLPAAIGIYSVAPLFIEVVLGEQWIPATEVMQLIALSGIFASITNNIGYVYLAKGLSKANFVIGLVRTLLYVPMLLTFLPIYGVIGAGYATLLSSGLLLIGTQIAASLTLNISLKSLAIQLYRPVISVCAMYYCVSMLPTLNSKFYSLMLALIVGVFSYLFTLISISLLIPRERIATLTFLKKFNFTLR